MTKEEKREYMRQYRLDHKEYYREYHRKWRKKQKEKIKSMEEEIARKREKERVLNAIFFLMAAGVKIKFVTDEEENKEIEA